jgi:hypothetical protein
VTFFSDSAITTMAADAPDAAFELTTLMLGRVLELPEAMPPSCTSPSSHSHRERSTNDLRAPERKEDRCNE